MSISLSEQYRSVMFLAVSAAEELGDQEVSPTHFLVGLVRQNDDVCVSALDRIGVSLSLIGKNILQMAVAQRAKEGVVSSPMRKMTFRDRLSHIMNNFNIYILIKCER